jgi:hypothetical protein
LANRSCSNYCNEWLQRPIACQFGFTQLVVGPDMMLGVAMDASGAKEGELAYIPIDELVAYLIDEHFTDAAKRRDLYAQLRDIRKRWRELGKQYRVSVRRIGALRIKCKHPGCANYFQTDQQAQEGQVIDWDGAWVTCEKCGCEYHYDGRDMELKLDE